MIRLLISNIKWKICFFYKNKKNKWLWRKRNIHNYTTIAFVEDISKIKVGIGTYGILNVYTYSDQEEFLDIGNYVSIASGVTFILGGNHQIDTFSSYPIQSYFIGPFHPMDSQTKGTIVIEDEVWIGANATILSGVTVGMGAIIAAGSLVVNNVPAFAIVAGNPAKIIKWRISEELIPLRKSIKLSEIALQKVKDNIDLFYKPLDKDTLLKILDLRSNE
jgi:virginiamycin A acetyltransferase